MKVLGVIDRPHWSYHTIAKSLVKWNPDSSVEFDILPAKDNEAELRRRHKDYDLVFFLGWQLAFREERSFLGLSRRYERRYDFISFDRTLTGVHSHRAWDQNTTTPSGGNHPPKSLVDTLARCRGVNVVSRRLARLFQHAGLSGITLTEPGVDTDLFNCRVPVVERADAPLRVGFAGSQKSREHDILKGVSEFIMPLASLPGVKMVMATPGTSSLIPLEQMPEFYNAIDLYLCMSNSEGFSQSVLEASACGRAIVSTRVGGNEDLIQEGANGCFVDRDRGQLERTILRLMKDRPSLGSMGLHNRERVVQHWSWQSRAVDWFNFMTGKVMVCNS